MTSCDDVRLSLGALVLSALDPAEERRVREHVAGCAECTAELAELERTAGILALAGPEVVADTVTDAHDLAPSGVAPQGPGPRVLDGLLAAVAAHRRRSRRRQVALGLAAAAAAAVVGGVVVAAADDDARAPSEAAPTSAVTTAPAPDAQVSGTEGGVALAVDVWRRGWGAALHVSISGVPGGSTCSLIAVRDDGAREVAATWTVPGNGYDPEAGSLDVDGAVGMQADRVSHFEVVTSVGDVLVTARV